MCFSRFRGALTRFFSVPVLLSALFLFPLHAEAMTPAKVFQKVSDSVVTVFTRENGRDVAVGTGIFTHPFGSTLTNFQAVQREPLFVRLQSGDVIPVAKVAAQDPEKDLALLVLDTSRRFVPVALATKLPKPGRRVTVVDAPRVSPNMHSEGRLISVGRDGETLRITARPYYEYGGGGIFNARGELIGVTSFFDRNVRNGFLSANAIARFLKEKPFVEKAPRQYAEVPEDGIIYHSGEYKDIFSIKVPENVRDTLRGPDGRRLTIEIKAFSRFQFLETIDECDFYLMPSRFVRITSRSPRKNILDRENENVVFICRTPQGQWRWFIRLERYYRNEDVPVLEGAINDRALRAMEIAPSIFIPPHARTKALRYDCVLFNGIFFHVWDNGREDSIKVSLKKLPGTIDVLGGVLRLTKPKGGTLFYAWEEMTRSSAPAAAQSKPKPAAILSGLSFDGLSVKNVEAGGIAEKAGLKAGDRIVEINARPADEKTLKDLDTRLTSGRSVMVVYEREGKQDVVTLKK